MLDQMSVDIRREFYLMLGIQELHKELKEEIISSYQRTQSRKVNALFICFFVCLFACSYLLLYP